jgi:penicillin-binding protein 1A
MIDHVNAIASLGRMGVYKPHTSILEVKNSSGEVLQKYTDESEKVVDPQAAYIVNDILGDSNARLGLFGTTITPDLDAAGIKTAIKTGTSDINRQPKDIWTVGYTPSLAAAVWLGNPDTKPLINGNSSIPAHILDPVLAYATKRYQDEGLTKPGEWFTRPDGIQVINGELFPSYYDRSKAATNSKLTFDRVSKKRATSCTPDGARVEIGVTKMTDPVTKKSIYIATDGYDATQKDDVHECDDVSPEVTGITFSGDFIVVSVQKGTFGLKSVDVKVDGKSIGSGSPSGGIYRTHYAFNGDATVTATVTDEGYYTDSASKDYNAHGPH